MAGQPNVFDFAVVIPTESGAPLTPPYGIVEVTDNLQLRSYFHCGGTDSVVRNDVRTKMAGATVQYFFQNLQTLIAPIAVPGGPGGVTELLGTAKDAAFRPGGDLFGLGLDPTDDYYISADTANITTGPGNTLQILVGLTGMWRVLTVLSTAAGDGVSAFDDNLLIQVIP